MSELITFPCVFSIKAMGANQDNFEELVLSIVRKHASIVDEGGINTRLSRGGRFVSITVRITANSQEQLDAIYKELSDHERVLMML